jgi:hypothetical protein
MDDRCRSPRGAAITLKPVETDLSVIVEWLCMDHAVVADLDLSCALYNYKVGQRSFGRVGWAYDDIN